MLPRIKSPLDRISKPAKILINVALAALVFGNVLILGEITKGAPLVPDPAHGYNFPITVGRKVLSTVYVQAFSLNLYHWMLAADVVGLVAIAAVAYAARQAALKRAQLSSGKDA